MAQTAKARLLSSAVPANCPFLRMSSGTQLTNYMINFGGQCPFLGMVESQSSRSLCSASPSRPLKAPHANVQRQLPVFPLEALYNFQLDQAENDTDNSTIFPFGADQPPEQGSFDNWFCINSNGQFSKYCFFCPFSKDDCRARDSIRICEETPKEHSRFPEERYAFLNSTTNCYLCLNANGA